ncbi:MAG: HD domain-containing protein [Parcubacteria group bacterium]|jgi:predicted hydrolase (HD superfamily)
MEELGITKQQASELVEKYITNPITKLHLIESEEIMKALARKFGEDEERWGIIGLLHDIDWDMSKDNTVEHCAKMVPILKGAGATDFLVETILSHGYGNPLCGVPQDKVRSTRLEYSLAAAETLTGLIVASAFVQPDKKLASVRLESLKKKFKSKSFAAGCDREIIKECEKAGVPLDEFLELGLTALQNISSKLGL